MSILSICAGCDSDNGTPHTIECNFQHFLSYSGLWKEPADVRAKLFMAYEANWVLQSSGVIDASRILIHQNIHVIGRAADGVDHDLPIFGDGAKYGKYMVLVALPATPQRQVLALSDEDISKIYRSTFESALGCARAAPKPPQLVIDFARAILAAGSGK